MGVGAYGRRGVWAKGRMGEYSRSAHPKPPIGRAKNSARPACDFFAGVRAPVLSRAVRVASPKMCANRAPGPALFYGDGPPGVAAQNRRGQAEHETIRWARRVFRPT